MRAPRLNIPCVLFPLLLAAGCGSDEAASESDTGDTAPAETDAGSGTGAGPDAGPDAGAGDATGSDTAPDTSTEPERAPDLGESCPMGCNLELCADLDSDCLGGACVFDGRSGIDAYCSQRCDDGECPAGYSCLEADDDTGRFCFTDPAVCGDGAQQRGEACDDGNVDGRDFCAPDCSAITTIPSWGRFTYRPVGTEFEQVFEGDEPRVYGYSRDYGDRVALVLGGGNSIENFGFEIGDITGLGAGSGLMMQTSVAFYPCNYNGIGNGLTVTEFDPEAQHIVGTFTTEIVCWANCFDCGGEGDTRTYEGTFDIHYIADPNL